MLYSKMADEIKFYSSTEELPDAVSNGNIYFILKEDDSAALVVDLNNQRYTVNPSIPLAGGTVEEGLISNENVDKLNNFQISVGENNTINISPADNSNQNINFNFNKSMKLDGIPVLTKDNLAAVEVIPATGESRIEIVEDAENPDKFILKLYLVIPTGPQGPQGDPGNDGADGQDGEDAVLSAEAANVTIGTNEQEGPNAVANFVKDENDEYVFNLNLYNIKGEQGEQGERGPAGEIIPIEFVFHNGTSTDPDDTNPDEDKQLETFWVDNVFEVDGEGQLTDKIVKKIYHVIVPRGARGIQGVQGPAGQDGQDGADGRDGVDGTFSGTIVEHGDGNAVTSVIVQDGNLEIYKDSTFADGTVLEEEILRMKQEGIPLEFKEVDLTAPDDITPQFIANIEKVVDENDNAVYTIYKSVFASDDDSAEKKNKSYLIVGKNKNISLQNITEGFLKGNENGNLSFTSSISSYTTAEQSEEFDETFYKLKI